VTYKLRSIWLCTFLHHQRAFRLPPWCGRDLRSSGMLRSVHCLVI